MLSRVHVRLYVCMHAYVHTNAFLCIIKCALARFVHVCIFVEACFGSSIRRTYVSATPVQEQFALIMLFGVPV